MINPNTPPWMGGFGDTFHHLEHTDHIAPLQYESGLFFYATAGLLDPKAPVLDVPVIARASGLGYWAAYAAQIPLALVGGLVFGIVFDPAHKFDNWGVDEVWHHSYDEDFWFSTPGSV